MVAAATALVAIALAAHAGLSAWPREDVATSVWVAEPAVLPLVAVLEQEADTRQRVLTLVDEDEQQVAFTVLADDGTAPVTGRVSRNAQGLPYARADSPSRVDAHGSLAQAVARLSGGQSDAVRDLAAWGVGVIVVPPGSEGLNTSLEQIPGVALMGASDRGTAWRVDRPGSEEPVSRAWLTTDDGDVPLTFAGGRIDVGMETDQAGVVTLAMPADPSWRATLDDEPLEPTEDAYGRAAFALPAGDGMLSVSYRDVGHQWWLWSSIAAVAWALLGSVPVHARRDAETRS